MIRYELYSNVASSEGGLQRHPELADLADTLRAEDVEVRYVRQSFREEEEVNLASSRHAKGVRVRGTSVRQVPVESHIKGCLQWLRAVAARAERGLHLEISNLRATNGAPLVFSQIFARKQRVFLSGLTPADRVRLTARPDPACRVVPQALARAPDVLRDYLARATRPTGFMALLQRVVELELAGPAVLPLLREILAGRDPAGLKKLDEAHIVNLGLIHETLERYEKLVRQFAALLLGEGALGDLPRMFELLTQGVALPALRRDFSPFCLEEKRDRIEDKRSLVNELRIGLTRADGALHEQFTRRLTALVVRQRLGQDPRLYAHALALPSLTAERLDALEPARALFLAWARDGRGAAPPGEETQPVPPEIVQGLFELVVSLVHQSRFSQSFRPGSLPFPAALARELLSGIVFDRFDIAHIRNLHPNLPARGVARNLADKVPVAWAELGRIRESLHEVLFPVGKAARELAAFIHTRHREQERQDREKALRTFLQGSHPQLLSMNYVLGRSGLTPPLRQAALAAGRALGLTVLSSRDQIRTRAAAALPPGDEEALATGYQLLMVKDDSRLFPLVAEPAHLASALAYLAGERVAGLVRRFVAHKIKYLYDLHGERLLAILHDHLQWEQGLRLSRAQLGDLLVRAGVFDRARLSEFGLRKAAEESAGENPLLSAATEGGEGEPPPAFLPARIEQDFQQAQAGFLALVQGYRPDARGEGRPSLAAALAALAAAENFDLHLPPCREALAATVEAERLTALLQAVVGEQSAALATGREEGDALDIVLPGPLAFLVLLRPVHGLELDGRPLRVRLLPGRWLGTAHLVDPSARLVAGIRGALGEDLRAALQLLRRHEEAWERLVQALQLPLLDQVLRETVLRVVQPGPPLPAGLIAWPEEQVLCLGASTHDQAKFAGVVAHPERREHFATLSELASWLLRFRRLGEELEDFREIIADVLEIVADLNLSRYDAPYISRYAQHLAALDGALAVRPEEMTLADLTAIERRARTIGGMVREFYDQERTVGLRDRWMSRIAMRLRQMRPHLRLTFTDKLHERGSPGAAPARGEKAEEGRQGEAPETSGAGKGDAYQTFSERVRNVMAFRERLEHKQVFVMSPNNTQRRLTLMLVDQLYRLKGVHTAILADISGCESFADALATRIPPHRLLDLNAL